MTFEVPSYVVLIAVIGFVSTQGVLVAYMRWSYRQMCELNRDLIAMRSKLFNGITEKSENHDLRLDAHLTRIENLELACARRHGSG